jgi:hypothetical protein
MPHDQDIPWRSRPISSSREYVCPAMGPPLSTSRHRWLPRIPNFRSYAEPRQRCEWRSDPGFRDVGVRALGREARERRGPTSCCSSARDTRRRFNTSAPAAVMRYTRASRDRLGSVARSHPRRAILASNGYNVPGLSRYPCRCSSSSIHCPYTPCSSAWCRMWIFQNPSKNSRTTGSVIAPLVLQY